MLRAENGALLYDVQNVVNWTKQGTAIYIGGVSTPAPTNPAFPAGITLQPTTNTTLGYWNGQMLATSNGDGTGIYAGQVAGQLINWDPNSTDTGQAVWNGFVIADPDLKFPLPILDPVTGDPFIYPGTILIASPLCGWILRQLFMYGPTIPSTDAAIVQTAVAALVATKNAKQLYCMNSSNTYETLIAY